MSVPPGLEFLDAGAWYAQHVAPQRARLTRQREVVQQLQALQAQVRGIATTRTAQAQRGVDQALMRALQGSTLQRIAESLLQRAWRRWWMTPIALLPLLLLLTQTLPPERLPAWSPLALALVGLALWTARPTWVGLSARLLRGPQLAGGVLLLLALALATQLPSAHWGGLSLGLVPAWVAAVCAAGAVRAWRRQQQLRPGPLRWTLEGGRGLELTLRALDGRVVPVVRLTRTELDAVGPLGDPVAQALTAWLRSRAGADVFQRLQQPACSGP